jgi:two-component system cell cycle sensor histidine kinase/response regulator CckA
MATALIVEDETAAKAAIRIMLERSGWTVLDAESPTEALRRCAEHGSSIDLLVTDVMLKDGYGGQLAKRLLEERPAICCLFISGYPLEHSYIRPLLEEPIFTSRGVQFLEKPFTVRRLIDTLARVMERKPA